MSTPAARSFPRAERSISTSLSALLPTRARPPFAISRFAPLTGPPRRSPADVKQQLEASLEALKTDYIDIYQFHSVRDAEFFNEELWKVLFEAKKAGKIRHIGNSISSNIDSRPQADASTKAQVEVLQ